MVAQNAAGHFQKQGIYGTDLYLSALGPALAARSADGLFGYVVTPNADHLVRLARDPSLRPDGVTWRANYIMPDEVEETVSGWWKLYQELFR